MKNNMILKFYITDERFYITEYYMKNYFLLLMEF